MQDTTSRLSQFVVAALTAALATPMLTGLVFVPSMGLGYRFAEFSAGLLLGF